MATRSAIGIETKSGIAVIYCHFDGFMKGVGKLLFDHYDEEKLIKLIENGPVSILAKNIDPDPNDIHDFHTRQRDACLFYGRDRGDGLSNAFMVKDKNDLIKNFSSCSFFYLMQNSVWYISDGKDWLPLEDELKRVGFLQNVAVETKKKKFV
jgi:hypothetical protein